MKDVQELYDKCLGEMEQRLALEEVCKAAGDSTMKLYHRGHINAFESVANDLIRWFGCRKRADKVDAEKPGPCPILSDTEGG